jgi:histone deacetylase complex regulatory component SIN3
VPSYKQGYSLLYGTELVYVVIKMISTIYERLLKARQLVEVHSEEIFKTEKYSSERFDLFVSLVLLTLSAERKLEANAYEDMVRELLGKDAYLLFVYDKLIATVSFISLTNLDSETHSKRHGLRRQQS